MYKKVSSDMNFAQRELNIKKFWEDNNIFKKSVDIRDGAPLFTFYDGPPTANGMPHIGHVITRVVKDLIPRYKTMKGYKVLRKAGWDTHGLPVELQIEKELGISGKPQIESYGVEDFIKKCKESVFKYETEWKKMSERVGYFIDMEEPYVTYHNDYIESVWWAIKQISDKGLLYKGHKIVPYCPRCGTSLSSHEVAQGYKDVTEVSVYAKFKLKGSLNEYFLAWTTTPWTLPSNAALSVNPKETYVKVKCDNEYYILAEALLENVLTSEYEIIEKYLGKDLEYKEYEPIIKANLDLTKKCYYVTCADFVTLTDGTGIVHTAPAFGEDDSVVGKKYDLPFIQLVNDEGNFVNPLPWEGMFVKTADPLIIEYLKENGNLYKSPEYTHNYPFCWRCDTHLLYYARDTWFIEMTAVRDKLIKNNETVNWMPENIKHGRFGNFLENVIDWGLSRERYWGTPLPIWECECSYRHTIGSIEELKKMSTNVIEDIELHKPFIDNVFLKCPKCSGNMKRVSEVIDCWFDSGCMPFAQYHYPFENEDVFTKNFPANFISEAVDQTRGWFYTMLAISTILFDKAPYENCIVLGHVQDENGLKMNKSKGNVINPWDVLNVQGADAVRWYFYANSAPWLPSRFYPEAVSELQRKFMGTLWNTYAFYILYANIDEFNPLNYKLEYDKLPAIDKWILSKLNTLVEFVDTSLCNYKITEPSRALSKFTDELSNWYVRRCRERFWASGIEQDKINAYMTFYTVLETITKLSAPFIPFMAEEIYQNLVRSVDENALESVHLCDYPVFNKDFVDKELEENMDLVLDIVVLGRAARNTANIKNRQPIETMYVKAKKSLPKDYKDIILDELNIKNIEFSDSIDEFTSYSFKPQLKTLGAKYGKLIPKISEYLKSVDGNEFMELLKSDNAKFEIDGTLVELSMGDVLYETAQINGFVSETDKDITVVINTNLSNELIEEGFVREIISKLQTMRKEAGFEVLDRILIHHSGSEKVSEIFKNYSEEIKVAVLCDNIIESKSDDAGYTKEWNINGEKTEFTVIKK